MSWLRTRDFRAESCIVATSMQIVEALGAVTRGGSRGVVRERYVLLEYNVYGVGAVTRGSGGR